MPTAPHLEFAPPPAPGAGRAIALALFVHALLVLALTWGIHWQDQPQELSVEAELWAAVPQAVAAQAPPAPEPIEEEVQADPPTPTPPPPPVKELAPAKPTVDPPIAIDKQKKKDAEEKALEEAQAKREAKLKEAQDKKEAKAKESAERKAEEAQRAQARHQEEVLRLRGLADATGTPADKGKAAKAASPSAEYLSRLRARVKPNITFADSQLQSVVGNPAAEVEVSCSPSGLILSATLKVKSGNNAWDQAVLNAVEKTASLPRDEEGNIPSKISFSFRPRD